MNNAEQLQAIIAAGREIHAAVDSLDTLVSVQLGIHRSDLRCLLHLRAGSSTPGEVACATGLTSGSVTALIDRLEAAGFVERRRSLADRRSVELCLPAWRRTELDAIDQRVEAAIRGYFAAKDADELAETARGLGEFANALRRAGTSLAGCPAPPLDRSGNGSAGD